MSTETRVGRTPEVTNDQIIEVGLKLEAEGSRISAWKLRNVIGAGTPARLMKVWENYKAESGGVVAVAETKEDSLLPPEVEDNLRLMLGQLNGSIESLAIQINNAAVRAADKRVQSEYEASKKAKENAEQELSEAEIALTQSDQKTSQLEEMLAVKEAEVRNIGGELKSKETESKGFESQLKKALEKIELLEKENKQHKNNFDTANIAAKTSEADVKRLNSELVASKQIIEESGVKLSGLEKLSTQLTTKLESAASKIEDQQLDKSKLEDKLVKVEDKSEQLHNDLTKKSGELGEANEKYKSAKEAVEAYLKKIQELQTALNTEKAKKK